MAERYTHILTRTIKHPNLPACFERIGLNRRDKSDPVDSWDHIEFHLADKETGKPILVYPADGMVSRETYQQIDMTEYLRDERYNWWKPASPKALSRHVLQTALLPYHDFENDNFDWVKVIVNVKEDLYLFDFRSFVDLAGNRRVDGGKLDLLGIPCNNGEDPRALAAYILKECLNVRMTARSDVAHIAYLPDKASFCHVVAMDGTLYDDDSYRGKSVGQFLECDPTVHIGALDILDACAQKAFAADTQVALESLLKSPDWLRIQAAA